MLSLFVFHWLIITLFSTAPRSFSWWISFGLSCIWSFNGHTEPSISKPKAAQPYAYDYGTGNARNSQYSYMDDFDYHYAKRPRRQVYHITSETTIARRAPVAVSFDLHGLTLQEASAFVNSLLDNRMERFHGDRIDEFHFITGRGLHSRGHLPKLKRQVLKICKKRGFKATVCEQNPGKIIVKL